MLLLAIFHGARKDANMSLLLANFVILALCLSSVEALSVGESQPESGSFNSLLRLPQEPVLAADGDLVIQSVSPGTYAYQHWYRGSDDAPGIWVTLAQRGLDYLKDVLLTQVLDAISPFPLPDITKTTNIPFVGEVSLSFTNVTLVHAKVPSSTVALGDTGIIVQALNAAANLTLSWRYDYRNIWLPGPVSDFGGAEIKVQLSSFTLVKIFSLYYMPSLLVVHIGGPFLFVEKIKFNAGLSLLDRECIEEEMP
ncbi:hypothetical protein L7F22_069260 [Adiantum nelumboides]|nr:hypothetical protein [Adiantum nelumboides]